MENNSIRHEIVSSNPDIDVRFYLSEDSGGYVAPHWHNSLELVYMIEGSMVTQFENNVRQTLHPGEFSIVNPRVIHSVTAQKNKALVLLIPSAVLEKYIPAYDLLEFHVDMHPEHPVDVTRLERIKKIFTDMYIVYDVRPDAYLLKFNSLLYDLLYTLVHSYSIRLTDKAVNKRNRSINKVKNIMRYIEDHHSEKIVMEDIAAHFGYNPDYLSKLFKKQLGLTVMQYLYEIRLHKVVRYMQTKYKLLIGERTAERLKIEMTNLYDPRADVTAWVKGRNLVSGLPEMQEVSELEIFEAVEDVVADIIEAIKTVLEETPPELVGDIYENGVLMAGGGAMLGGLRKLVERTLQVKCVVAKDAIHCVAKGTAIAFRKMDTLLDGFENIAVYQFK